MKSYVDSLFSLEHTMLKTNQTMVAEYWRQLSVWFWNPYFWLPRGMTWENLKPSDAFNYPDCHDVWTYPFFVAALMLIIRAVIINPLLLQPIAISRGLSTVRVRPPTPNKELEKIYLAYGKEVPHVVIKEASNTLCLSIREVNRWVRRRFLSSCQTKFDKFCDCGFQWIFHTLYFAIGWCTMYSKEWVWDISLCWKGYPHHEIDNDIWWYYMIGLGFFWSITAWLFIQANETSENFSMYLHHIFTILLMSFSWTCNFTRIGSLVLLVHECADIPRLLAKMCLYAKVESPVNPLFALFVILWVGTRNVLYPFWILRSVFFEAYHYTWMPAAFVFYGLLSGLLILNFLWSGIILKVVIRKVTAGKLEDIRSDDEHFSDNSGDDQKKVK